MPTLWPYNPFTDLWFQQLALGTLAVSLASFLLMALPWTLIAWLDPVSLRRFKVQATPFDIRRWFWPSLRQLAVNAGVMAMLLVLSWPLMRLLPIHTGPLPSWWLIILQLGFFLLLDDALYYGMHRLMHRGWLLRHVHSVHHRIRQTTAINGNYMHPLEFALTGTLALAGPALLGAHLHVLWLWIALRQFEAVDAHCGYQLPWSPLHWLPGYDGAGYHDFHHAKYKGNYAGFFGHLDRWLGTQSPGFAAWAERRKG